MKTRVCHIITRLIRGGAQENTIATVELLHSSMDFEAALITGPALGPEGTLIPYAQERISRIYVVDELRRAINPYYDLISFFRLYYLIRKGKYDIVHTHSSKAGILGRLAAKLAGVKIIVHTIHGLPYHPYQNKFINLLYVLLERFVSLFTDRIITVADAMTEKAAAAGVAPKDKFVTIYSGMDLDAFIDCDAGQKDLRGKFGFNDSHIVIGKIARLFDLKGHKYVIEAAKDITEKFPNVRFLFVGDGSLRKELESTVKGLGLGNKVVFAGLVNEGEIPKYIGITDIVVHASLREGLARVIPQSFAEGKPVVSFDIDGAKEVVKDGVTGYIVEPCNVQKLVEALTKLIKDRGLRLLMGGEGRKLVDPVFRNEYMVEKIEEVYRDLIARKLKGPAADSRIANNEQPS